MAAAGSCGTQGSQDICASSETTNLGPHLIVNQKRARPTPQLPQLPQRICHTCHNARLSAAMPRKHAVATIAATMRAHIESEYRRTSGLTEDGSNLGSSKSTPWFKLAQDDRSLAAASADIWRKLPTSSEGKVQFEVPSTLRERRLRAVEEWRVAASKETSTRDDASMAATPQGAPPAPPAPPPSVMMPRVEAAPPRLDWLPKLEASVMGTLGRTPFAELLPLDSWERLESLGLTDFDPLDKMWQQTSAGLDSSCTSPQELSLAKLFQYYLVCLVDSQLLARVLRRRVQDPDPSQVVVGVVSGVLSLDPHDTLLGIMEKSGSVGKQIWKGESKKKYISAFPAKLAVPIGGEELKLTREAALLEECERVGQGAVDDAARDLPEEVEASVFLVKLTNTGLKAEALATLVFLAKYNSQAPTYRTRWSSLYAGELTL